MPRILFSISILLWDSNLFLILTSWEWMRLNKWEYIFPTFVQMSSKMLTKFTFCRGQRLPLCKLCKFIVKTFPRSQLIRTKTILKVKFVVSVPNHNVWNPIVSVTKMGWFVAKIVLVSIARITMKFLLFERYLEKKKTLFVIVPKANASKSTANVLLQGWNVVKIANVWDVEIDFSWIYLFKFKNYLFHIDNIFPMYRQLLFIIYFLLNCIHFLFDLFSIWILKVKTKRMKI